MRIVDYAARAYQAYGDVTGFKNFQGNPMPRWDELPPKIQQAWEEAVYSVMIDIKEDAVNNEERWMDLVRLVVLVGFTLWLAYALRGCT